MLLCMFWTVSKIVPCVCGMSGACTYTCTACHPQKGTVAMHVCQLSLKFLLYVHVYVQMHTCMYIHTVYMYCMYNEHVCVSLDHHL